TITWALGPEVPCRGTGMSRSGGVGIDGHFYVIAGQTFPDPQQQDSIFIFNTTSGTWQTPLSGRGTGAAANYWGVVSAKDIGGKINIFIPGGTLPGGLATTFGLYVARSGGCDLTTGISNLNLEIPNEYSLSQNYPNPFNPATKINFSIPVNGLVTLKIYNVLGKEVMTLINEHKPAGNYGAEFNGANLSSGIYFFRMETGEFVDVKRMMLIK
ncbi:MAG: T9SS type A sorting domain-containing protein, partial [Saprospiraceae bacterium]